MLTATPEQKKILRKHRTLQEIDEVRYVLINGCLDQTAYIQWSRDLAIYGLWESLLYIKTYEDQGMYASGTAQKALNKAIAVLVNAS